MKIINKNYKLKGSKDINIVLISDIHYYNKKEISHLNKVLENIKKIKPNYICIPGDLIDESNIYDEDYLIDWLKQLTKICKVILSIGNHELYIDKSRKIFKLNEMFYNKIKRIENLYLLDNKNIILDDINFIGITLPIEYYFDRDKECFKKYFKKLKSDDKYYNILLCHSPMHVCDKELLNSKNIDLVLCGHMHGGIVPHVFRKFVKNRGLISPGKGLFPKYSYGHIVVDKTNVIITSGIIVISHINSFRILKNLFSSEIVKIQIKKN